MQIIHHPPDKPPTRQPHNLDPIYEGSGALFWLTILHAAILLAPPLMLFAQSAGAGVLLMLLTTGRLVQAGMFGFWIIAGPGALVPRVVLAYLGILLLTMVDFVMFSGIDRGGTALVTMTIYLAILAGSSGMVIAGTLALGTCTHWLGKRPRFSLADMAVWTVIAASALGIAAIQRDQILDGEIDFIVGTILLAAVFQGIYVGMLFLTTLAKPGRPLTLMLWGTLLATVPFLVIESGAIFLLVMVLGGPISTGSFEEVTLTLVILKLPLATLSLATILPLRYFLGLSPPEEPEVPADGDPKTSDAEAEPS